MRILFRSAVQLRISTAVGAALCTLGAGLRAQDVEPVVTLTGRVQDVQGRPIPLAEILINDLTGRIHSGDDGTFRVSGIEPGRVTVTARRLGFTPATVTRMLPAGERQMTFVLELFPHRLAMLRVIAPRPVTRMDPRIEAFNRRRAQGGGGTFITRGDIERLQARQMTDLFILAPGFRALRDRRNGTRVATRGNASACRMRFYIDGMGVDMLDNNLDLMVRVQDVEAVELYRGISTAPAEFSGVDVRGDASCGVIVVWTRLR